MERQWILGAVTWMQRVTPHPFHPTLGGQRGKGSGRGYGVDHTSVGLLKRKKEDKNADILMTNTSINNELRTFYCHIF